MRVHNKSLPDRGHANLDAQFPGSCTLFQRRNVQVQPFSEEWSGHDHNSLLPVSAHPDL